MFDGGTMVSQAHTRTPLTPPFWGHGCALSGILVLIKNHNKPVHLKLGFVGLDFFSFFLDLKRL